MSRASESGEQATLGDAVDRAAHRARSRATAEGARYGRSQDQHHDGINHDPDRNECARDCETAIDATTARVLGDEDGVVPVCENCVKASNGRKFSTTAKAVRHWLTDRSSVVDLKEDDE